MMLTAPPLRRFSAIPSKLKTLLAASLLLCAGASIAQEMEAMFTIWVFPDRAVPQVLIAPPPKYPKRLAALGMKGWVKLKFTINEQGEVTEPEVVDMHPGEYFARTALQTISRYKFAPPMLNGEPTPLPDVTVRMTFDPDK